jgi:hypothetical protein
MAPVAVVDYRRESNGGVPCVVRRARGFARRGGVGFGPARALRVARGGLVAVRAGPLADLDLERVQALRRTSASAPPSNLSADQRPPTTNAGPSLSG